MNNDRLKFRLAVKQGLEWKIYDILEIQYKLDGTIWVRVIRQTETVIFTACFQVDGENAILEQCTGLRDKDCNLIYEGDVLRVEDDDGVCNRKERIDTGIGTVEWVDELWYIAGDIRHCLFDIDCTRNIEIIGNVHETEAENV